MAAKSKVLKLPPLTRVHGQGQTTSSQSSQTRRQNSNSSSASSYASSSKSADSDTLDSSAQSLMHLCNYLKANYVCRYNKVRRANETLISCLVDKSLRDRLTIQRRVQQLYSIDLDTELKEALGLEFGGIVSGLLRSPYSRVAMELHQLVEDLDPYAMVDKLLLYGRKSLSCICSDYKKQFGCPIMMDVLRSFGDQRVSRLLTALIRGLLWPASFTPEAVTEAAIQVQHQETMLLEETSVLLVGLQKYGPSFLIALSEAHRAANPEKPLLQCLRATYDASLFLLARKLLDPTEADGRVRDLLARLERLVSSGGRELVHQLVMLVESPRVLAAVNRQLLTTRNVTLRDLALRGCSKECTELLSAVLAAPVGAKRVLHRAK